MRLVLFLRFFLLFRELYKTFYLVKWISWISAVGYWTVANVPFSYYYNYCSVKLWDCVYKICWYWLIVFWVILTFGCSLRACHMWLTRNHMFICEIWGKFTSFIFWNFEISRFKISKKVKSANLSQISLLNY